MAELLEIVEKTIDDKQGSDTVTIDMRSVNPFADYFVITTAKNLRHANSLAEDVMEACEKSGFSVREKEGEEGSNWILIDLFDVIVHVFTEDGRNQYRLENLWGDLPMNRKEDITNQ